MYARMRVASARWPVVCGIDPSSLANIVVTRSIGVVGEARAGRPGEPLDPVGHLLEERSDHPGEALALGEAHGGQLSDGLGGQVEQGSAGT